MKTPDHIQSGINALHAATAALRMMGVEILSASANSHRVPEIHVVDPGTVPQDARYVRCVFEGRTHYAVMFQGCEVVWIEPRMVPGAEPTQFTENERTTCHG